MMYTFGPMGQMMNGVWGGGAEGAGNFWPFFGGFVMIFWVLFQVLLGIGILVLIWLWIKKLLKETK